MLTLNEIVKRAETLGLSKLDAHILLAFTTHHPISYFYGFGEKIIKAEHIETFNALVQRRINGEPIAYILGEKEFWSLTFKVTKDVLIPRSDTESLVEKILDTPNTTPIKLLDLGTGSGAIAISVAKNRANWSITAIDYSLVALKIAKENAKKHGVEIEFKQSDWFENLADLSSFDIIVSNPPYIAENDLHLLAQELSFEPKSALISSDEGYRDLACIIKSAVPFLTKGGVLYVEHGYNQSDKVKSFFLDENYINVNTICDLQGHPRVTYGYKSN